MCTNTYSNRERFDKVIAETKWCSFLLHSVHPRTQTITWSNDINVTYYESIASAIWPLWPLLQYLRKCGRISKDRNYTELGCDSTETCSRGNYADSKWRSNENHRQRFALFDTEHLQKHDKHLNTPRNCTIQFSRTAENAVGHSQKKKQTNKNAL